MKQEIQDVCLISCNQLFIIINLNIHESDSKENKNKIKQKIINKMNQVGIAVNCLQSIKFYKRKKEFC